jgi:hypothetical protein
MNSILIDFLHSDLKTIHSLPRFMQITSYSIEISAVVPALLEVISLALFNVIINSTSIKMVYLLFQILRTLSF